MTRSRSFDVSSNQLVVDFIALFASGPPNAIATDYQTNSTFTRSWSLSMAEKDSPGQSGFMSADGFRWHVTPIELAKTNNQIRGQIASSAGSFTGILENEKLSGSLFLRGVNYSLIGRWDPMNNAIVGSLYTAEKTMVSFKLKPNGPVPFEHSKNFDGTIELSPLIPHRETFAAAPHVRLQKGGNKVMGSISFPRTGRCGLGTALVVSLEGDWSANNHVFLKWDGRESNALNGVYDARTNRLSGTQLGTNLAFSMYLHP